MDWFPLWLSLEVALAATVVSTVVGVALAYWLAYRRFWGRDAVDALITLPLALPPTVLGYYLLLSIGRESALGRVWESVTGEPLVFTVKAAIVAACLHTIPLLVKMARASMESIDPGYLRVARSLGAPWWRVLWQVVLPLSQRGIGAAAALGFARALGDFGITIMVAGNVPGRTQTVAVAIYEAVESGRGDVARVLVLVVSAVTLGLVWWANRLTYGSRATRASR